LNSLLLHIEIQQFIKASLGEEVSQLAFQKNPFPQVEWVEILNQISAIQKAKNKLPSWFNTTNIIYPSKISVEQTSSEKTAAYKAQLVSGESLIDLTGGFGVDDFYFSKRFKQVIHCEINVELSEIVQHNSAQLQLDNLTCIQGDSTVILKELNRSFDWIYLDPSRRNDSKGKVFMLQDCLPNVPDLLDFYFEFTSNILVKTAPILDLTAGLSELKNVKEIHIVAVDNEVKELLWVIEKQYEANSTLHTCNLKKDGTESFSFEQHELKEAVAYAQPQQYLYEPNAAIMKSGGFDEVAVAYGIAKLHPHSHLYTATSILNFPGRVFKIDAVLDFNKKEMKSFLEGKKANITTRNFPDTVETIRKKWKIKEGGDLYCFFTTSSTNEKIVLLCTKIK
jgi:protein-L-isoaspartate O-methyltransferase